MGLGRDLRPPQGGDQPETRERVAAARRMLAAIDATVFPDDEDLSAPELTAQVRQAVLRMLGDD